MLWSELFFDRPRLVRELAKYGTTPTFLVLDYRDVDLLRNAGRRGLWSEEELLKAALLYFGDQGNPQPAARLYRLEGGRTPDWDPLAPLEEGEDEAGGVGAPRTPIPTDSFWMILEQRVKNGEVVSVRSLSERTRRSSLGFVGRTLAGELVKWIDENPERARRAWDRHEIPAGFRATRDGVLVPRD